MIHRLFVFTRAAASGAMVTSFACAYHCYHYTQECSMAQRAAMQTIAVYESHADALERSVKVLKANGDKRIAQELMAARQRASA